MGVVNYPRVWLSLNGQNIPCIKGTASRKSKRASDTFTAEFSATRAAMLGFDLNFWADYQPQGDAVLMMSMAVDGSDLRAMVTGEIDKPEIRWLDGIISVSSRDKSAALTKTKRSQNFTNQKSSDVVNTVAQDNGLTAQTSDTGDFSGQTYSNDTNLLSLNRSDWELMDRVADREGFRWYVDGTTLYFEPEDTPGDTFSVFYQPPTPEMIASGNVITLTTSRNMDAAKPHQVTVKSHHHQDKKVYEHTESLSGAGSETITHEHHHNGHNQAQVEKLAKSKLKNATRHDMSVSVSMPLDLTCDVRMQLALSGTGTIYDQSYDIDSVEFEIDWGSGGKMDIAAKAPKAGRS